jgi:acyl-CoA dehydrogenase
VTISTCSTTAVGELASRAAHIGAIYAGPVADQVDADARFPREAIEALREDAQMSALVPRRLGGQAATIGEVADATSALAAHCASTAMIYAMHQLSVACLVRHGANDFVETYLRELVEEQHLVASATTETGTGGDIGSSICAVEQSGGRYRLEKQAPVISYGAYAHAVLATERRCPDSPPNDQVMVLCASPGLVLEPITGWDALGFRGTCSSGFRLVAEGDASAVLPVGFDVISAETNLPVSHILWAHVWLGLATAALRHARTYVQSEARKRPGSTPAGAVRLAELDVCYRQMAGLVRGAARRFDEAANDPDALSSLDYAVEMNALKVSASRLVVEVVGGALLICGMAGYREDSPFSMGRLLRDAYGAPLMLSNDRLVGSNAQMLLVGRGVH